MRFYRPSWQTLLEPDRPGVGDTLLRDPWRLRPRYYGLHACPNILDALQYARGSILCRVELGERVITDGDLSCASARTILAKCENLEEAQKSWHLFACWAASRALEHVSDPRSRGVIEAKKNWLNNEFPDRRRLYKELLKAKAKLCPSRAEKVAWTAASDKAGWLVARQTAVEAAKAAARVVWAEEEAARTTAEEELGVDLLLDAIGESVPVPATPAREAWDAERDAQSQELERLAYGLLGDVTDLVPEISRRTPFSYGADHRSDAPEPGGMDASVDVDSLPCPGALENYRGQYEWKQEARRGKGGCQMLWRGALSDAQIAALSFDLDAIELLFSGSRKDDKEIVLDFSDLGSLEKIGNGGHATAAQREGMDGDELENFMPWTGDLHSPADTAVGAEPGDVGFGLDSDHKESDSIDGIIDPTKLYGEDDLSIESFEEDDYVFIPSTPAIQDERRLDLLAKTILELERLKIGNRKLIEAFNQSHWPVELRRRVAGPARTRHSTAFQYDGDIPEEIRTAWLTALKTRAPTSQLSGKAADLLEKTGWALNAAARRGLEDKRELYNDLVRSRYKGSSRQVTTRFVLESIIESDKPPGNNWFCYSIAEINQDQENESRTTLVGYRQGTADKVAASVEEEIEAFRERWSSHPGQEPETVSHTKRFDKRIAREAPTTYCPSPGIHKPWNPNPNRPLLPPGRALDGGLQADIYQDEPKPKGSCGCTYRGGPCELHSGPIETSRKLLKHG